MKGRLITLSIGILCGLFAWLTMGWMAQAKTLSNDKKDEASPEKAALMIKQWMKRSKASLEVDEERYPELLQQVEQLIASSNDAATTALLHSMLAEMYQHYYQQNRWQIDQRSALKGYVPKDVREWSGNLFEAKIDEELNRSLQPDSLLKATPTRTYQTLLATGADGDKLRPTLYEFLAYRAIEMQPSASRYEALLAFQRQQPHGLAALLTELDRLRFLHDEGELTLAEQLAALERLYQEEQDYPHAAEILIAQYEAKEQLRYESDEVEASRLRGEQLALCQQGMARYANYPRTALLRNFAKEIEQPSLNIALHQTLYPGKEAQLRLTFQNVRQATIRIYESKRTAVEVAEQRYNYSPDKVRQALGRLVATQTVRLNAPNSYTQHDTLVPLRLEAPGLYECIVSTDGANLKTAIPLTVSRLLAPNRNLPDRQREVWVTDWATGEPVANATVVYYGGQRYALKRLGETTTDHNGFALLPADKGILAYQATRPNDTFGAFVPLYSAYSGKADAQQTTRLSLFTDRGLYRPGQTLFFKGIAYSDGPIEATTKAGEPFTVILYDANRQEVAKQQLTTNDFGSFHGEFTLPQKGLSGRYQLVAGKTHYSFQVEEYKRPTFHADIQPLRKEVAFGDSVGLQGKAESYAGVALTEGKVAWRILRRPFWGLFWRGAASTTQVAEGKTTLTNDGRFELSFTPQKDKQAPAWRSYERYELIASVTDSKGETQTCRYSFSVGETSLVVTPRVADQVEKANASMQIDLRTLNGEPCKGQGRFSLVALHPQKEETLDEEQPEFEAGETLLRGDFIAEQPLSGKQLAQLPSGRYRLLAEAADPQGRISRGEADFTLYSRTDKRPPYAMHSWLLKNQTECLPGETAEIVFGSSDSNAHLLYEWFLNGKRIHQEWVKLSNANRTFQIPFLAEYGEGLMASFSLVQAGKLYVSQVPITRRLPDRKLTIKPITFRNRLQPGQPEHWRFQIATADSLTVAAEALASLYDASLDQLLPFAWNQLPLRTIQLAAPRFAAASYQQSDYKAQEISYTDVPSYHYDALQWFGLFEATGGAMGNRNLMMLAEAPVMMKSAAAPAGLRAMTESAVMEDAVEEDAAPAEEATPTPPALRTDFAETAFFYPALQTDETGNLWVDFTLPESNTSWKFQLLSHSQSLQQGLFTQTVTSSKPLMVSVNLPRFVRQGDLIGVSAQVVNQSEQVQVGRAAIELFDPATNQPLLCLSKAQQPFELQPDSALTVGWKFAVPASSSLLGVRIIADGEKASDGEQHLLPILSDQLLLTESQPLYVVEPGEHSFAVKGFEKGQRPYRLTFELTANPIWYAVQAISSFPDPASTNSVDQMACYYTNTLAAQLLQSHPRLKAVISQWQAEGNRVETLQAALQRNEELKNILLEETPWIMEAHDEATRKQRLSLLFDLNRAANQRQESMRQLQKLQTNEGGFCWFEGFPASRTLTTTILELLAQLTQLNAAEYNEAERTMIYKALSFLDRAIEQDYELLRRSNRVWAKVIPSDSQVDYLYVRSLFRDIPEMGNALEASKFYSSRAMANWEKYDLLHKAELGLLAHRNGDQAHQAAIMAWLKRTASTSAEQGMYWANNRQSASGVASPVWTHCRLMELFETVAPNRQQTDRMKQWLLNQKRVQDWVSTPATLQAIHTLLYTGSDWVANENRCEVTWGSTHYDSAAGEAATGYLKATLPTEPALQTAQPTLTLRKTGTAPAWGAVYTQYFQAIDQAKEAGKALKVERKLFVERTTAEGRHIQPLGEDEALRVGDKVIVRLVIRSDRDYQYVCLKDSRAGCLEPTQNLSGYAWRDGVGYYQSSKDASTAFFFELLPQGTYVIEYSAFAIRSGEYASGLSTLQCLYAPEFVAHSAGGRIKVE